MTQEKIRVKFRVSAFDGISSAGLPEPRWVEKWGVNLFDYEEFHVTDQLLKLPFQENPPKTVCTFSISGGSLAFRILDEDRRAEVNGVEQRESLVSTGDKIKIGDTLTIEVVLAPPKSYAKLATANLAPVKETPRPEGDGPTLTLIPMGELTSVPSIREPQLAPAPIAAAPIMPREIPLIEEPAPPVVTAPKSALPALAKGQSLFKETSGAPEIMEPSFKPTPIPPPAATLKSFDPKSRHSLFDEPKIELQASPHLTHDESLGGPENGLNPAPVYAADADLRPRLTFGEKILSAFAKMLRRDDLDPPEEPFAADTRPGLAKPWIPAGMKDPGITPAAGASYGTRPVKNSPSPQPWIPEALTQAARMRGRALVFVVAAIGALMIAVGVFRIQNRVAEITAEEEKSEFSKFENSRGIPIDVIEEKVRRMRRPQ